MLRLYQTRISDLEKIVKMENDSENSSFIIPYNREQHLEIISSKDAEHLTVFTEDKKNVGFIILAGLKNSNDSIELRRIIISDKGNGYGKKAVRLITKRCFEDYKCNRLWLDVFDFNKRAKEIYEKSGFVKEGILRESYKLNNEYKNLVIMSILKSEYFKLKQNL